MTDIGKKYDLDDLPDMGDDWPGHVSPCVGHAAEQGDVVGRKYDHEKPRMDLIPPRAEWAMAEVLTYGAQKYGEDNWRHVENRRARYLAAALRHINAYREGHDSDEETHIHHLAHAMCCLAFIVEEEA